LGRVDDAESVRAIHFALDAGINFFDTAANDGCVHSECVLGKAGSGRRRLVILATRLDHVIDEEWREATPADDLVSRLPDDCEASLRRLNTDSIDLYQLHRADDPPARAAEVCGAPEKLVEDCKTRRYGWSTNNPDGAMVFA
jgi:aryl-alcohol dehydrogenase-like predicted oxidoreductase